MILNLIFIGLIYFSNLIQVEGISCQTFEGKEKAGTPHDWVAVYKPPTSQLKGHLGYFYKTSDDNSNDFIKSERDFERDIMSTLDPVYDEDAWFQYSYIMYNDVIPKGASASSLNRKNSHKSYGKGKGVLIWDNLSDNGIWIKHSVNEFPPAFSNRKTGNYKKHLANGHIFLCLNIKSTIVEIIKILMISKVKVYDSRYVGEIIDEYSTALNEIYPKTETQSLEHHDLKPDRTHKHIPRKTQSTPNLKNKDSDREMNPNAIENHSLRNFRKMSLSDLRNQDSTKRRVSSYVINKNSVRELKTLGGKTFKVIAYRPRELLDFWQKVAKNLDNKPVKLYVKSAHYSSSFSYFNMIKKMFCYRYNLIDILGIKIHTSQWKSELDGSKWAVCEKLDWFCVSDFDKNINRNVKQAGLIVCLGNANLSNAFKSIIHQKGC